MHETKRGPWPFVVLAVLILLAVAAGLYLAARLTVAPRMGETVEVDTDSLPAAMGQSVDEVVFYPWGSYDPDAVSQSLPPDQESESRGFYLENLIGVPDALGLLGASDSVNKGITGPNTGFWTDCPVATRDGQPALLDVAFGRDGQNFGMTWVARSTGEPPTQTQRETALDTVTQDVCLQFLGGDEDPPISDLLWNVEVYLSNTSYADDTVSFSWSAKEYLGDMLLFFEDLYRTMVGQPGRVIHDPLEDIRTEAEDLDLTIQLVTTQRQVVAVFTYAPTDTKDRITVGVYYDMVLEQYSGVVINAIEDTGM